MTSTVGHIQLERSIDSIQIGSRHRVDLGDIDALASSIEREGLLQPITVTPEGVLVCGVRRLAALRQLGVRKLNVWVRSGISDRLTELLAEQDDNKLHKPLTPTESATLYRELKVLFSEDAARRQAASRFHAEHKNRRSDGAADSAAPSQRGNGDTRVQAARMVTGNGSYSRLEQINELQRVTGDETASDALRAHAAAELAEIDLGGAVLPAQQRINAHLTQVELESIARDVQRAASVRSAAFHAAERLNTATSVSSPAELEQLAREAMNRVQRAQGKGNGIRHHPGADDGSDATLPPRAFVFLWTDMRSWWLQYDAAELASALTDEQWEQFEATLAGTIAFADSLRALRSQALTSLARS